MIRIRTLLRFSENHARGQPNRRLLRCEGGSWNALLCSSELFLGLFHCFWNVSLTGHKDAAKTVPVPFSRNFITTDSGSTNRMGSLMVSFTLIEGRLLRRYKRFLADCEVPEHGVVTAHCPNTGSMKTLVDGEPTAWLRHVPDPKRKLPWTLTLLRVRRGKRALVDTSLPNQIVADGILDGIVTGLGDFEQLHREVSVGEGTRLDIVLGGTERPDESSGETFIEVKNVTMLSSMDGDRADFPDSVTLRGRKHLEVLTRLSSSGKRAVLFLLLGRTDCNKVGFAEQIDPAYCDALRVAVAAGVEIISHRVKIRAGNFTLGEAVPVELPD